MRTAAFARVAVVGLTFGLFALTALAVYGTVSTAQTTFQVRNRDAVSNQWIGIFQHVNFENEMLLDYLKTDSQVGRQPLISAVGSAEPNLRWLETHAGPAEATAVTTIRYSYEAYTDTLRQLIEAGKRGDQAEVAAQADASNLGAASLRKLAVSNVVRSRLEMNTYLAEVDAKNRTLRIAAGVIGGADFLLLSLCAVILLSHQRRIERQAVASRHQALHDGLTGIPNRVLMQDRLDQALHAASRHNENVALLLLDLNRFKDINDVLGHHSGDMLLKIVAKRLVDVIRTCDTVARLGGDEFAVVLSRVDSVEHTMEIADRLLKALELPADLDGIVVDVSGSIGAAVFPHHSQNSTELLQHADIAMYTAKRGHLGSAMYEADADEHSADRLALLGELRQRLEDGELVLHNQPKT
jgi:diguanylate cyclase (GGDEF)-like protein